MRHSALVNNDAKRGKATLKENSKLAAVHLEGAGEQDAGWMKVYGAVPPHFYTSWGRIIFLLVVMMRSI